LLALAVFLFLTCSLFSFPLDQNSNRDFFLSQAKRKEGERARENGREKKEGCILPPFFFLSLVDALGLDLSLATTNVV